MPWIVGLDEAGYGPNLGPLVQAAVVVRVPDDVGCLWQCLKVCVRRATDTDDGRVLIDDSKLVHSGPNGLARLERAVVGVFRGRRPLGQFLERVACGATLSDLGDEPWFAADEPLPIALESDEIDLLSPQFKSAVAASGVEFRAARCVATPAPRFNHLLDRWDTKSAILEQGVITLLREALAALPGAEPILFVIDKQGGRNYYAPLIQAAFPDAWVSPQRESAESSEYTLDGLGRKANLVFRPRADAGALPVALASMVAKYLREVFMRQFNRHWQKHIPDLKPTAGYPNDAKRFFDVIRPVMERLNIPVAAVWRRK